MDITINGYNYLDIQVDPKSEKFSNFSVKNSKEDDLNLLWLVLQNTPKTTDEINRLQKTILSILQKIKTGCVYHQNTEILFYRLKKHIPDTEKHKIINHNDLQ